MSTVNELGSLTVKTYKPRKGYNPSSKIVVQLPERKAIRFKLAKRAALKKQNNN
ncbi:MAG: HU family DNA-binding protein [Butyricimonas faecihominis]